MEAVYQFDNNYLKQLLRKTEKKLSRTSSSKERQELMREIELYINFLKGHYEGIKVSTPSLPKDLTKAKQQILINMKSCYKDLGEDTINWLLQLEKDALFSNYPLSPQTNLDLSSQVLLTEENYQRISPILYKQTKRLLRSESSKIQEVPSLESSSFCHRVLVTDEPLIIVNPSESPVILNHEIEHAAEMLLKYRCSYYYQELGPLYMEHQFLERLYEQQVFLREQDYAHRFQNIDDYLQEANSYLRLLRKFKERDFYVSTDEFIKIICDYEMLGDKQVLPYIYEKCVGDDEQEALMYILSYLRSIELYDTSESYQGDHLKLLRPDIANETSTFNPPQEGYKVYEKHIRKMQRMTK